jgi:hypothetical protein
MRVNRAIPVLLFSLLAAPACSDESDITGVWQAGSRNAPVDVSLFYPLLEEQVGMQLVLGQFSRDVAGVLSVCLASEVGPGEPENPDDDPLDPQPCIKPVKCEYTRDGRVSNGWLYFYVEIPVEGETNATRRFDGEFDIDRAGGEDVLVGTLVDLEDSEKTLELVFTKVGDSRDIDDLALDEGCPVEER